MQLHQHQPIMMIYLSGILFRLFSRTWTLLSAVAWRPNFVCLCPFSHFPTLTLLPTTAVLLVYADFKSFECLTKCHKVFLTNLLVNVRKIHHFRKPLSILTSLQCKPINKCYINIHNFTKTHFYSMLNMKMFG